MKNYLNLKILAGLLIAGTLLTGCFDDITKTYDGPPVVEFAQYDQPFSNNNYVSTVTFAADTEEGSVDLSLLLQLIAPHFGSDTHIGFQVVENQLDMDGEITQSTTAQEGVHYNFITSNNQAVFAANESLSNIEVTAIADELEPGDSVQLIIMLTESDMLFPAENYKYFRIVVSKAS